MEPNLAGIDSIEVNLNDRKMTVIGTVDPVDVVEKLRKGWAAELVSVGPKEEPKKDGDKKEGEKKDGEKKSEEEQKKENEKMIKELVEAYKAYNPCMTTHYYVQSAEENPNACVIL